MKDGGKLKHVDLLLLPLEELRDQVLELDRDEAGLLVAGLVGHVLGDLRKRQKVEVEVERAWTRARRPRPKFLLKVNKPEARTA